MLAGALAAHSPPRVIAPADPAHRPDSNATEHSPVGSGAFADTELLRQCRLVRALEAEEIDGSDDRWSQAVRRVSELRPTTLAGLHAKAGLALQMLPFGLAQSCPAWASTDERLIWSLLSDLLALSDPDAP